MIIAANIAIKNPLRYEPERIFIVLIPFLAITLCLLLFGSSFFSSRASSAGASSAGASAAALHAASAAFFSASALLFFVYLLFSFQTCFCFSFLSFVFLSLQSSQTALFVVLPASNLASASASPNAPFATPPSKCFFM